MPRSSIARGPWEDKERIGRLIAEEIPPQVAGDRAYQNAMAHSDRQNARIEFEHALQRVMVSLMADQTELFKQYSDNEDFRRWVTDTIFWVTYQPQAGA